MKTSNKLAVGVAISLALGTVAVAYAHPGAMGGSPGPGAQAGPHAGMQHGARAGHGPAGMQHGLQASQAVQQLMTPEERTATLDKMRAAKTPEERRQIATATRAEMQKRAAEKGITLPEELGPRFGTTPQTTPDASVHTH